MALPPPTYAEKIWLAPWEARKVARVGQSIIYQWVAAGLVREVMTPGGNRRWHKAEIEATAEWWWREGKAAAFEAKKAKQRATWDKKRLEPGGMDRQLLTPIEASRAAQRARWAPKAPTRERE